MPKVKTDSSVCWNRCGLSSVPGQNSSTTSDRREATMPDSSRFPVYTRAAPATNRSSVGVPSNAWRKSSNPLGCDATHPSRLRASSGVNSDIFSERRGCWYPLRSWEPMPTTGNDRCRPSSELNLAIPHVHGFRWYPAMQSIIRPQAAEPRKGPRLPVTGGSEPSGKSLRTRH